MGMRNRGSGTENVPKSGISGASLTGFALLLAIMICQWKVAEASAVHACKFPLFWSGGNTRGGSNGGGPDGGGLDDDGEPLPSENWEYRTEINNLFGTTRPNSELGLLHPKLVRYEIESSYYIFSVYIKEPAVGEKPTLYVQRINTDTGDMVRDWNEDNNGDEVDNNAGFNTESDLLEDAGPDSFRVTNVQNDEGIGLGERAWIYISSLERPQFVLNHKINIRRYRHVSTPSTDVLITIGGEIDSATEHDIYAQYDSNGGTTKDALYVLYTANNSTSLKIKRYEIPENGDTGEIDLKDDETLISLNEGYAIANPTISDMGGGLYSGGRVNQSGKLLITCKIMQLDGSGTPISQSIYAVILQKVGLGTAQGWNPDEGAGIWHLVAGSILDDPDDNIPPYKVAVSTLHDKVGCVYRMENEDGKILALSSFDHTGKAIVSGDPFTIDGEIRTDDGGTPLQFDAIVATQATSGGASHFSVMAAYILSTDNGARNSIWGAEVQIGQGANMYYDMKWRQTLLPDQNASDPTIVWHGSWNQVGHSSQAIIFWKDVRTESDYIYAQKVSFDFSGGPANFGWDSVRLISTAPSRKGTPSATEANNDEYVIAWQDDRNVQNDIYGGMIDGDGNYGGDLPRGDKPTLSFETVGGGPAIVVEWSYPPTDEEERFPLSTIDYFSIWRSDDNTGLNTYTEIGRTAANETQYVDQDVTSEDTTYRYKYKPHRREATGPLSQASSDLRTPSIFAPHIVAAARSGYEIAITIQNNSSTAVGLEIEKSNDGGSSFELLYSGEIIEEFVDAGLELNTTYFYRARVFTGTIDGDLVDDDGQGGMLDDDDDGGITVTEYSEYSETVSATTTEEAGSGLLFGPDNGDDGSGGLLGGLTDSFIPDYLGSGSLGSSRCYTATAAYKATTQLHTLISLRDEVLNKCVIGSTSSGLYLELAPEAAGHVLKKAETAATLRSVIKLLPATPGLCIIPLLFLILLAGSRAAR